jgi:hypothetical protein
MTKHVAARDAELCAWCRMPVEWTTFVLHHIDYDHECVHPNGIEPETKGAGQPTQAPDCKTCFARTPKAFAECARRLVTAHAECQREMSTSFVALRIRQERQRELETSRLLSYTR